MTNLGVIFFHRFPPDLLQFALDSVRASCDYVVGVYRPDEADPANVEQVQAGADLMLSDPPPYAFMRHRLDWTAQRLAYERVNPETILFNMQDQILPNVAYDRARLLADDKADFLMAHLLHTWGDVETVVSARQGRIFGAHAFLYKWRPDWRWHPWRGYLIPANAHRPLLCSYPIRHMPYTRPEMRAARSVAARESHNRQRWAVTDDKRLLPFDPTRTWAEWLRC